MIQEHQSEMKELYDEINEKNRAIEEIREYYHGVITVGYENLEK